MKPFLIKLFLFCLLVVATNLLLLVAISPGEDTILRAVSDKEDLLRRTEGPKIVFVGGSSLGFGLDSSLVDAAFPEHAVVNMGLQGSIGLRYMLAQVTPYIGSGDVVVLNLEFPQLLGMAMGDDALLTVWQAHPEGRAYVDHPLQYWKMARNLPLVLSRRVEGRIRNRFGAESVYRRSGFNAYGDVVSHLDEPGSDQTGKQLLPGYDLDDFDEGAVRLLNAFGETCRSRGAKVFLLYPAITEHHAHENRTFLEAYDERLRTSLEIGFLCRPEEAAQADDTFYDTVYHLDRQGRAERTQRIIAWLEAAL